MCILISDFKKHILWKLNKVLYKLDAIENRLDRLQEKEQSSNQFCNIQEIDILLLIRTIADLTSFEEQLKERKFQDDVVCYIQNVRKFVSTIYITQCIIKSNPKILCHYFPHCIIK